MPSALPSKTVALLVPKVTLNFMSTFQTKELFSIHHHVINLKPNPPPPKCLLISTPVELPSSSLAAAKCLLARCDISGLTF